MTDWDTRFMDQAIATATWSKDRRTKVGAVAVSPDKQFLVGYNGFPRGVDDDIEERHDHKSGEKYYWSEHAERNVIYNANYLGVSLRGWTMFATCFPCMDCARGIVQVGIVRVVAPTPIVSDGENGFNKRWFNHTSRAGNLFEEVGITVTLWEQLC